MLARETDEPFSDDKWVYELKWDGFRAIAELRGRNIRLYSRNGNSFAENYPVVANALRRLNLNAVIDGEIVVMDEYGRSDFQSLQQYRNDASKPMEFRVFDLLELNGANTCHLPLVKRKAMLRKLLPAKNAVIKYSDHVVGKGQELFRLAEERDLEGIIAKEADSGYYPGTRTSAWLKIKHHKSTEAVIGGFTEPAGSRKHFGALLLGVYDGRKLRYIGHTGTGFNSASLRELYAKLAPLRSQSSPFSGRVKTNTPAVWAKPELVAEIKYSEWTRDGILRHPVFLRLRTDKKPKQVTMAAARPLKAPAKKKGVQKTAPAGTKTQQARDPEWDSLNIVTEGKDQFLKVGRIKVKVTNLEKTYWPEEGYTKGDVIAYYQEISTYILPFLKGRPQSLLRNPNGIRDKGFFHKDAGDDAPGWVKSEPIFSPSANKIIDYIVCDNAATIAYLNNLGCIELNPWHSTVKKQDHPDYLIIDIDPSDRNTFDQVIEAAQVVHDIFERAGVKSYCKTSGASGLHVYAPAGKKYTYDQLKDFSQLVCMLAQQQLPHFTTLERNLKKRGDKRIYMDYLQNRKGQTISSVFSLRPRRGATVSMPLDWKEVKPGLSPDRFHIGNAVERIRRKSELFAGVLGKGLNLEKSLKLLGG